MAASSATDWPPSRGLTTQIVPREAVVLPTHGSIEIDAPAALVWSLLLDTTTYSSWCSFSPRVTVRSQPETVDPQDLKLHRNTHFTFHVIMDSKKPNSITDTALRVTDISTPKSQSSYIPQTILDSEPTYSADLSTVYRVAWTVEGGFVARGLKSERFHEIILRGDDKCEVRTWECQGGPLARAVKWMYKDVLLQKFQQWCEDLKKEAEKMCREETDGVDAQTAA